MRSKSWCVLAGAILSFAACSNGAPAPSPAVPLPSDFPARAIARDSASQPKLYVTDYRISPGTIDILNTGGKFLGRITSGVSQPYDLTFDAAGNLYTINSVGQVSNVTVYAPGKNKPELIRTRGIATPISMAANANGLYVLNYAAGGVISNLVHFAPGAKNVDYYRPVEYPAQVASDAGGTIYLATNGRSAPGQSGENNGGNVYELSPAGKLLRKTKRIPGNASLQSFALDPDGTLYVVVSRERTTNVVDEFVNVYPPGSTTPSRSFPVKPPGYSLGLYSAFVAADGSLYIVAAECPQPNCSAPQVSGTVFVFPRGGSRPTRVLRSAAPYEFYSVALDRVGNLYAIVGLNNNLDYRKNILEVFSKGSAQPRILLKRSGLEEVVVTY